MASVGRGCFRYTNHRGRPGMDLGIFLLILLGLACSPRSPDDSVLARMGRLKITREEFRIAYSQYLLGPGQFDSFKQRRRFLDRMVGERLLALQGRKEGLDRDQTIRFFVESFHDKLARDQYIESQVFTSIEPSSETELETVYDFLHQERRIRHLFAPTEDSALALRRRLDRGESFEALARSVFTDSVLNASGGELGWVRWDQMERSLADGIFHLPIHTISDPIRSKFGFHIVRVEDVRKDPLLSQEDFQKSRSHVRFLTESAKKQEVLDEWVKSIRQDLDITVDTCLFPVIRDAIASRLSDNPAVFFPQQAQLTSDEVIRLSDPIAGYRNEAVAWSQGKPITVETFIRSLVWIPRAITRQNLLAALGHVARDLYVDELARKENLDRIPSVQKRVRLFEEDLVQKQVRARLIQGIRISDKDVNRYYKENIARYPDFPLLFLRRIVARNRAAALRIERLLSETAGAASETGGFGTDVIEDTVFCEVSPDTDPGLYSRAITLRPGEVSPPVQENNGYSLVVVIRKVARNQPFEKVKELLMDEMTRVEKSRVVPRRINELKKGKEAEIDEEGLRRVFLWDRTLEKE